MKITWIPEKIQYLTENYNKQSAEELAKYLGCSDKAVYQKAFKLGLKGRDPKIATRGLLRKFSESDVKFLKQNYEQLGPSKCSELLNKNKSGLIKLARRLGLKSTASAGLKTSLKHKENLSKRIPELQKFN